jgi:predicted dienelactone hydrolase
MIGLTNRPIENFLFGSGTLWRQSSQATEDYLPSAWRTAIEHRNGVLFSQFLTRDLAKVRTHSIRGANVAPEPGSYPVVFLRAGLAAQTTTYTTVAEDLASYGYVVVGFDVPYRTTIVVLPDGKAFDRAEYGAPTQPFPIGSNS